VKTHFPKEFREHTAAHLAYMARELRPQKRTLVSPIVQAFLDVLLKAAECIGTANDETIERIFNRTPDRTTFSAAR
jgi:hypothetical protein